MDSKPGDTLEYNGEGILTQGQDSGLEATRCGDWEEHANSWLKPKSPKYGSGAGKVRKREEYEEGEEEEARLAWALKNWPMRDIPIPSIETSPDEQPEPKRYKSISTDKFEILWNYLENNTPDLRSPTLFPSLSPISDLGDSPPSVGTDEASHSSSLPTDVTRDTSLSSSTSIDTAGTADYDETIHCDAGAGSDPAS